MHAGGIAFFRVRVDHMLVNLRAVGRQAGLEQFVGSAALAFHMGPQEDIAQQASTCSGLVCQDCFLTVPAGQLWEALGRSAVEKEAGE